MGGHIYHINPHPPSLAALMALSTLTLTPPPAQGLGRHINNINPLSSGLKRHINNINPHSGG